MPLSNTPLEVTRFTQSEPASTWEIKHTSPGYPIVDVYISVGNQIEKILPSAVVYIDQFTVEVRFEQPRSGFATVVI